jgi:hypothetical protein
MENHSLPEVSKTVETSCHIRLYCRFCVLLYGGSPIHRSVNCHKNHTVSPVWWPGLKYSPTVTYACRKR